MTNGTSIFTDPVGAAEYWPIFMQQLFIILILVKVAGKLLSFIKQPPVIGEIMAGIIVGPSVLGQWDWWASYVFPPTSWNYFTLVGDIGLILFMFTLGLELDEDLVASQWRKAVPIACAAIFVPFATAAGMAFWLVDVNGSNNVIVVQGVSYPAPDMAGFVLFICAAMSFTAFPVLASILTATDLITTPLGITTISASAVDDVLAWSCLAIATSVAKGSGIVGLYVLLIAIGYVLFQMFVGRKVLTMTYDMFVRRGSEDSKVFVTIEFLVLLLNCYFCELLGIHSFFGAFVAGLMSPKQGNFVQSVLPKLELLTVEFLLPLFFASSGMRTDLGALQGSYYGAVTVAIIVVAMVAKMVPTAIMTKLVTKRDFRFSFAVGILMSTRGLVALIALNIGLSLHILSDRLFTMMIVMALVTTFCTSPLLWLVYQRSFQPERLEDEERFGLKPVREIAITIPHPEVERASPLAELSHDIREHELELGNLPRDTRFVVNPHKVAMQLTRLAELLPAGWELLIDNQSGRHFFANRELKETCWTFPATHLSVLPPERRLIFGGFGSFTGRARSMTTPRVRSGNTLVVPTLDLRSARASAAAVPRTAPTTPAHPSASGVATPVSAESPVPTPAAKVTSAPVAHHRMTTPSFPPAHPYTPKTRMPSTPVPRPRQAAGDSPTAVTPETPTAPAAPQPRIAAGESPAAVTPETPIAPAALHPEPEPVSDPPPATPDQPTTSAGNTQAAEPPPPTKSDN